MALDEQYQWAVGPDGVKDATGQPKKIGVGIEDGRVVVNTRGYASFDDDAADVLTLSIEAAKAVIRQQRRRS
jgi:hypothetical protein